MTGDADGRDRCWFGPVVTGSGAAGRAAAESVVWAGVARVVQGLVIDLTPPSPCEVDVVGVDPTEDLHRRGGGWGFGFSRGSLDELARFAAGLAQAEADAWEGDDPSVATKAYEHRRFLVSDRIAPWAVPWADVAGRAHPASADRCHQVRDTLLSMADTMRIAPLATGDEGIFPPGEDAFGPLESRFPDDLGLLGAGTVVFDATTASLGADARHGVTLLATADGHDLATLFERAASVWSQMADSHEGSARLWRDLSRRAESTRLRLGR